MSARRSVGPLSRTPSDSVTPGNPNFNPKSARAKTLLKDNATWGAVPADQKQLANDN